MKLISFMMILSVFTFGSCTKMKMKDTVDDFLRCYMKYRPSGIPDERMRKDLEKVVSKDLYSLLCEAGEAEKKYVSVKKNEGMALFDGDIFSSLFEGATSYDIGEIDTEKKICSVNFTHREQQNKLPPVKWTDRLVLVNEKGIWKVDDIEYGGDWEYAQTGTLRELLKNTVARYYSTYNEVK
jgi:hypothetical protein